MKTKCYCIFCVHHPLHDKQKEFKEITTGYKPGLMVKSEFDDQGIEVECLRPVSDAFYELGRESEDFKWEVTAYGDGCAITGVKGIGYTIWANCKNEKHEEI